MRFDARPSPRTCSSVMVSSERNRGSLFLVFVFFSQFPFPFPSLFSLLCLLSCFLSFNVLLPFVCQSSLAWLDFAGPVFHEGWCPSGQSVGISSQLLSVCHQTQVSGSTESGASLLVTSALLVVTMFAIRNKCLTTSNKLRI